MKPRIPFVYSSIILTVVHSCTVLRVFVNNTSDERSTMEDARKPNENDALANLTAIEQQLFLPDLICKKW